MKTTVSVTLILVILLAILMFASSCSSVCYEKIVYTQAEKASAESFEYTAKGTVIAYGGGFDQSDSARDIITGKSIEICGKTSPKVLFLPTGGMDILSPEEPIIESYKRQGCEVETLLPSKATHEEIVSKIAAADIIYETGGNLRNVSIVWAETGVNAEMRKAYERGAVLIGVSTGAMCWAEMGYDNSDPEIVTRVIDTFPFIGKDNKYNTFAGAGIIPFCLLPHYDNIQYQMFTFAAPKFSVPSIALDNGTALIYHAGSYSFFIDPATPNRKAYLFYPERNIFRVNVTSDTGILTLIDGYRRANGYAPIENR